MQNLRGILREGYGQLLRYRFFFFSSRRRHTRFDCDWSSDVCSSDLLAVIPKLWVQIADGSTLPGHRAGYVATMGGRKRVSWRARTVCRQRGRFQLGPVTATSGDPFGLFRRRAFLTERREMLVLPRVLPIRSFALFTGGLPGRGRRSRRALHATTNSTTIRDYIVGDALSRIHWRSSAHYNKLMVKEFELDPAGAAWLFF